MHLVWSWPDVLPLSDPGYDVQRLEIAQEPMTARCETIDGPIIAALQQQPEYPAPLGPLRLRTDGALATIAGPQPAQTHASAFHASLPSGWGSNVDSSTAHPIFANAYFTPQSSSTSSQSQSSSSSSSQSQSSSSSSQYLSQSSSTSSQSQSSSTSSQSQSSTAAAQTAPLREYVQELTIPVSRATVQATAAFAFAVALYRGEAVAAAPATGTVSSLTGIGTLAMDLRATWIDTVVVYVRTLHGMTICAYDRPQPGYASDVWSNAPYIAHGLTLPVHETDAPLVNSAQEYAKAMSRTVAANAVTQTDFQVLTTAMRVPAGASALGRSGERTLLVRTNASQSYVEMPFEAQLSLLSIHPELRRALGLGFIDRTAIPGRTYVYRITAHVQSADLHDDIYDVHLVPSATGLPAAFSIRGLGLRFQTPVQVVLDPAPSATALNAVSRRGIRIDTTGYDASWFPRTFTSWSAIIDFPRPVTDVVLEVAPGHTFTYAAGVSWAFAGTPAPLPAGPRAHVTFPNGIMQLRLSGTGTLFAIRIPSSTTSSVTPEYAHTPPITFAAQPMPAPPTVLLVDGLQQPPSIVSGPIGESTRVAPRPPPGFKLHWLPAFTDGETTWPDDIDSGPPLDATAYVVQHRRVTLPSTYGPWNPIMSGDNITLGSSDTTEPEVRLEYGCDLDELFPRVRPSVAGASLVMNLSDIFGEKDPTTGVVRPAQAYGSYHQYQIAAMDAAGRVSTTPTLSNVVRLEKHAPPPLPVGPQPAHGSAPLPPPVDAQGHLTTAPGPRVRAIVKGAKGLTPTDLATLGTHQNAVVLQWGWRAQERALDPDTAEFRVYATPPPDVLTATIVAVTAAGAEWQLAMTLATGTTVPLVAGELAGSWIESNGYPFRVMRNSAGLNAVVFVEKAAVGTAQPAPGTVTFGRALQPALVRPGRWRDRVAIYPVTAAENYEHVFYDALALDASHPLDTIWVGVSAADAQDYVVDERFTGANANRFGNESAVAACTASARYRGQPLFSLPPPLGDVPELVTDEPTGRRVLVSLDVNALLGGALAPGTPISLARCSSDDVLSQVAVSGNAIVLTNPDGSTQTVTFANAADQTAALATLSSDTPQRLANKYLLHLVVASNDPAAFFTPISGTTQQSGVVEDRLAPKPGRWMYFARKADPRGHVSQGGAILPVVVRVPSMALAATPRRRAVAATNTSASLTVAIPADPDTVTALLFARIDAPGSTYAGQAGAELLRIPNRRDLYPLGGIRLRLADGTLLAPVVAKNLADADVVVEPNGARVVTLTANAAHGSWATLWCYALTRDGIASYGCGPIATGVST